MLCGSYTKIWNLANHMKKQNKKHQKARLIDEKMKTKSLMFFVYFFHVICKILNSNMWTTKHLAQASCTELTLTNLIISNRLWPLFLKRYNSPGILSCFFTTKVSYIVAEKCGQADTKIQPLEKGQTFLFAYLALFLFSLVWFSKHWKTSSINKISST